VEVGGVDATQVLRHSTSNVVRVHKRRAVEPDPIRFSEGSAVRFLEVVCMTNDGVHIVVGVELDEDSIVLRQAAKFARHFDATLVCVISDPGRYAASEAPDGTVTSLDIDPDQAEYERRETFDQKLRTQVDAVLGPEGIEWTPRAMAGDPAVQLAHVADEVDAVMIVVGSHRPGRWGAMREFLNGSVAAHLVHRQHRPVVVIPLNPIHDGGTLPWQASS
jgi:nucleotide-binding universal stress UspA family protein